MQRHKLELAYFPCHCSIPVPRLATWMLSRICCFGGGGHKWCIDRACSVVGNASAAAHIVRPPSALISPNMSVSSFSGCGVAAIAASTGAVGSSRLPRSMQPARWAGAPDGSAESGLKVMSWNVLADGLAQAGKFAFVADPDTTLAWSRREAQILHEIDCTVPDVVCLQECNRWYSGFEPSLCVSGEYCGVHTTAGNVAEELCGDADGEALLVRRDRLELLSSRVVRFSPSTTQRGIVAIAKDRRWVVDDSGDAAACGDVAKSGCWVLATVHLKAKAKPQCQALRQQQVNALMTYTARATQTVLANGHQLLGVVLCGDFNENPDSSTGIESGAAVPRALSQGPVELSAGSRGALEVAAAAGDSGPGGKAPVSDAWGSSGPAAEAAGPMGASGVYATVHAWPGLQMRSAYAAVGVDRCTVAVEEGLSTFKVRKSEVGGQAAAPTDAAAASEADMIKVAHIIDYIWLGAGCTAARVLELPSEATIGKEGLPMAQMPSDHVPLVAIVNPAPAV